MTVAEVRALVAHYGASLTAEDAHLIARHMADVDALLRIVVGIVRRAAARHRGAP